MKEKAVENSEALRLVVLFPRSYARKSQVVFSRAAGLRQSDLSRYESGQKTPSEEVLQRMAAAAGLPWPLVLHLRRFYDGLLAAVAHHTALETDELLDFGEPALLAVRSYLLEDAAAEAAPAPPATKPGPLAWPAKGRPL
jgi:transcriptional regulator with XRE-family HTH domain